MNINKDMSKKNIYKTETKQDKTQDIYYTIFSGELIMRKKSLCVCSAEQNKRKAQENNSSYKAKESGQF